MLQLSEESRAAHEAQRPGGPHRAPCHAPFTSMYFDQFGNVLACCINTVRPMGTYPAQRIRDIWDGIAARQLRGALADGDFSLGCHDCHSSISSGNHGAVNSTFDEVVASTDTGWIHDHPPLDDGRDPWPRLLEFSLSSRCNLRCTMCSGYFSSSIRRADGLSPFPEVYGDDFVEELRPFLEHVTATKFYGGEPFLAPVNFAIWEALAELNPSCRVAITTNGTVWNDRVRAVLERLDTTVTVSIDAATTPTYEGIRLGADHAEVIANLDRFAAVDGCSLDLTACAMRQNWRELPDLVHFASGRGLHLGINVVRYPQDHSLSSATEDELHEVVATWSAELESLHDDLRPDDVVAAWNVRNLRSILAEAQGWLAVAGDEGDRTGDQAVAVGIGGGAPPARVRRRAWLELLARLTGRPWPTGAERSEDAFHRELDVQLELLETVLPSTAERAVAIARGIRAAGATGDERPDADLRFARFAAALDAPQVTGRIRLLADMPPGLIAQGVAEVDPDVIAERVAAFFPASGERRRDAAD